MADRPIEVAFNPAAPRDEQQDAMTQASKAAMPSSVPDLSNLINRIKEEFEEEEMTKALAGNRYVEPSLQSFSARNKFDGMQSVFLDERRIQTIGEYYEPTGHFQFDMMRQMVDNTPVLSAVIMTRQRQLKRFCRVQEGGRGPGFKIRLRDSGGRLGENEMRSISLLEGFFTNCGWERNPRARARARRSDFSGFMAKQVRDSLIMDSAPIELEWKKDKSLGIDGFYAVDGATIRLCTDETAHGTKDEVFAIQVVQGSIRSKYTYDDLIYVPRNPRSDVMIGGYGMSETELLIKVVTGFLNAMTHNLKYFDSNSIPRGILNLSGDYANEDLAAFKRYWNAMVRGVNNSWALPVMVSKNGESQVKFDKFDADVNEIMFSKWMTFLTAIICAIYGMAPEEINFESFSNGPSTLSGSDTAEKIINSKDKGFMPLMGHFEDLLTDHIVSDFSDQFVFRWTGLDGVSPSQAFEEEKLSLRLNEFRKSRGLDEIDEDWGNAPLNPNLMAAYQSSKQSEGQDDDYGTPPDQGADQEPDQESNKKPENKQDNSDEQDEEQPEQPEDLQKSFGLPVWRIEP